MTAAPKPSQTKKTKKASAQVAKKKAKPKESPTSSHGRLSKLIEKAQGVGGLTKAEAMFECEALGIKAGTRSNYIWALRGCGLLKTEDPPAGEVPSGDHA